MPYADPEQYVDDNYEFAVSEYGPEFAYDYLIDLEVEAERCRWHAFGTMNRLDELADDAGMFPSPVREGVRFVQDELNDLGNWYEDIELAAAGKQKAVRRDGGEVA